MTRPSPEGRTAPLLVRLSPTERADLERVRREMGLRTLAETVRALPDLWRRYQCSAGATAHAAHGRDLT